MRKPIVFLFALIVLGTTMYAFAADVEPLAILNETNNTTDINNTFNTTNNSTNSSSLNSTQLEKLNSIQAKISAVIATIDTLTTTYKNNAKAKGLLNALAQYKKQALKLNAKIEAFKANPQISGENDSVDSVINSFNAQALALEKKVTVKSGLLNKLKVKNTKKSTKKVITKKVTTKKVVTKKVNNKKVKN